MLVRIGTKRFGAPTTETLVAVNAITDPTRLEALADRVLDATDWGDLLQGE